MRYQQIDILGGYHKDKARSWSNEDTCNWLPTISRAQNSLTRAMLKMTAANGGKNPFTPMSNGDVELISRNVANLDVGQPDADFQAAVQQYEDAYRRAFIGAKGSQKALRDALVKLGLEKGQAKTTANDGWSIEEVR